MKEFNRLYDTVKILRNPETGCPWDKKQTSKSLLPYFLEEVYELMEAIENDDYEGIKEELGDVMLHIVFQAILAEEKALFKIQDVLNEIVAKLIYRHPHVFGDSQAKEIPEIKKNWEVLKKKKSNKKSILDGVPRGMPSLLKAQRIHEKVSSIGFDWENEKGVIEKIKEETQELEEVIQEKNQERIYEEFGDLLFALVSLGKHLNISAEFCLNDAIKKFIKRFKKMELIAGQRITNMNAQELDELWNKIKK